MTRARAAVLGAVLLLWGAAPARAQHCRTELTPDAGARPGVSVCSELGGTSSSASLWALPGLASEPSVYDAFVEAIGRIPRRDGLRGWATADAGARFVSPRLGPVSLVGEFGAVGWARLSLPSRSLDYFRSDTLADSLYWSFDGVHGVGVVFRSVGGGAVIEPAAGWTVGATVDFLEAEELVGGRVAGGMLESFDGLDVDVEVEDFSDVHGSGTMFGFFTGLVRDGFRAALSVDRIGAAPRLAVRNRVREADSLYQSTEDAVDALGPAQTASETVDVEIPARLSLSAGRELGPATWLWIDSDLLLARGYQGGNRVGARVVVRPAPWVRFGAGGGWSSGIDASVGLGVSAGRVTWTLDGRGALNGRDVSFATGLSVH